jgi:hypothetical protein
MTWHYPLLPSPTPPLPLPPSLQAVNGFLYRFLPKSAQAKLDATMASMFGSLKGAVSGVPSVGSRSQ